MFNFKPENLVGDTNKLLFAIFTELKENNDLLRSMRKNEGEEGAILCNKSNEVITAEPSIQKPSRTQTRKPQASRKSQGTRKKALSSKTDSTKTRQSKSKEVPTI